jgi:DGQHR domain-containing protein
MELVALKANQKGQDLYTTHITSDTLWRLAYTLPKSKDNKNELERKLVPSKVNRISDYLDEPKNLLPNNIVLNLTKTDKITVKPLDEKHGLYRLVFTPFDEATSDAAGEAPHEVSKGKYGYVVDGQHRGVGAHQSAVADTMPLVVTFLWDASRDVAFKTFADINENQTKVPKLLTTYIRREIHDVSDMESSAFDIASLLNEDGPLKGRIRFFQDEKGTWVNSPSLIDEIEDLIGPKGPLFNENKKNQRKVVQTLKDYFHAWQEAFPAAWGSPVHVLTKGMGIAVALRVFDRIYHRCDFFEGGRHGYENFLHQLKELAGVTLDIEGTQVPLHWESGTFASYSSGAGINKIVDAIHAAFPERP